MNSSNTAPEVEVPQRFSVTGASGDVYDVAGDAVSAAYGRSWLHSCRDRHGRERLYRQYTLPLTDAEELEWVGKAAEAGRAIVLAAEQSPNPVTVPISWPIDRVWQPDGLAGVVLPVIPPEFLGPDGTPLTLDQLYSAEPPIGPEYRVAVAIRLCELFEALGQRELVHGDIAPQNLLWSRSGVYLLGGDGLRSARAVPVRRPIADAWRDPRVHFGLVPGHDAFSDRLGVAMLVYRTLFRDGSAPALVDERWQKPSDLPSGLDPWLRSLFERAFDDPSATADRPIAGEWRAALNGAFGSPDGVNFRADALALLDERPVPTVPSTESDTPRSPTLAEGGVLPLFGAASAREKPESLGSPTLGEGATIPPFTGVSAEARGSEPSEPQQNSSLKLLAAFAAAIVAVVCVVLGVRSVTDPDSHSASSNSTYTSYSYSSPSTYPPTSTTPAFDRTSLDLAATDKTPFTASALLPQSFRDAKNVNYTLRSSGVMDCITPDMSQNVRSLLQSYHCDQQVAGSYVDDSNKILVSVNVMAFNTAADASRLYESIKGQTQDWSTWCPHTGAGSDVCGNDPARAKRSGYSAQRNRYLFETTSLYINLSRDPTVSEWLDPAAQAGEQKAGPENYWHK